MSLCGQIVVALALLEGQAFTGVGGSRKATLRWPYAGGLGAIRTLVAEKEAMFADSARFQEPSDCV